ncbi:MAG: C39 family peptidase [Cyanobacteriota bacterium]
MSGTIGSSNQSLFNEIDKSFKNDRRIDKTELQTLKTMINSSDLDPKVKESAINFLEKAKDASDGFLGIFGKNISNKEMGELNQELGKLKDLVNSLPDNQLAKDFCNTLETSLAKPVESTNQVSNHKPDFFESIGNFISKLFSGPKDENKISSHQTGTSQTNIPFLGAENKPNNDLYNFYSNQNNDFNSNGNGLSLGNFGKTSGSNNLYDFYVSQGNGLKSSGSDCGPSCATMVLKRFGVFDSDTTGAQGTRQIRSLLGQSNHAIDEGQVEKSIESLSGGAVRKTSSSDFSSSSSLINYAKQQLAQGSMPILLTGSPYHDDEPNYDGRHYMVITGIDQNGNIQLADPGGKYEEMSPERLAHLMNKTGRGTSVMAFNTVA